VPTANWVSTALARRGVRLKDVWRCRDGLRDLADHLDQENAHAPSISSRGVGAALMTALRRKRISDCDFKRSDGLVGVRHRVRPGADHDAAAVHGFPAMAAGALAVCWSV
jgi:hypothetical protein